jgi:NADPH:quinone reductase-like Zn-dependent oxidoreductase
MLVEPDLIGLRALSRLVDEGKLKVHVSQTFHLEDIVKAHEAMESGGATGKIVITVA